MVEYDAWRAQGTTVIERGTSDRPQASLVFVQWRRDPKGGGAPQEILLPQGQNPEEDLSGAQQRDFSRASTPIEAQQQQRLVESDRAEAEARAQRIAENRGYTEDVIVGGRRYPNISGDPKWVPKAALQAQATKQALQEEVRVLEVTPAFLQTSVGKRITQLATGTSRGSIKGEAAPEDTLISIAVREPGAVTPSRAFVVGLRSGTEIERSTGKTVLTPDYQPTPQEQRLEAAEQARPKAPPPIEQTFIAGIVPTKRVPGETTAMPTIPSEQGVRQVLTVSGKQAAASLATGAKQLATGIAQGAKFILYDIPSTPIRAQRAQYRATAEARRAGYPEATAQKIGKAEGLQVFTEQGLAVVALPAVILTGKTGQVLQSQPPLQTVGQLVSGFVLGAGARLGRAAAAKSELIFKSPTAASDLVISSTRKILDKTRFTEKSLIRGDVVSLPTTLGKVLGAEPTLSRVNILVDTAAQRIPSPPAAVSTLTREALPQFVAEIEGVAVQGPKALLKIKGAAAEAPKPIIYGSVSKASGTVGRAQFVSDVVGRAEFTKKTKVTEARAASTATLISEKGQTAQSLAVAAQRSKAQDIPIEIEFLNRRGQTVAFGQLGTETRFRIAGATGRTAPVKGTLQELLKATPEKIRAASYEPKALISIPSGKVSAPRTAILAEFPETKLPGFAGFEIVKELKSFAGKKGTTTASSGRSVITEEKEVPVKATVELEGPVKGTADVTFTQRQIEYLGRTKGVTGPTALRAFLSKIGKGKGPDTIPMDAELVKPTGAVGPAKPPKPARPALPSPEKQLGSPTKGPEQVTVLAEEAAAEASGTAAATAVSGQALDFARMQAAETFVGRTGPGARAVFIGSLSEDVGRGFQGQQRRQSLSASVIVEDLQRPRQTQRVSQARMVKLADITDLDQATRTRAATRQSLVMFPVVDVITDVQTRQEQRRMLGTVQAVKAMQGQKQKQRTTGSGLNLTLDIPVPPPEVPQLKKPMLWWPDLSSPTAKRKQKRPTFRKEKVGELLTVAPLADLASLTATEAQLGGRRARHPKVTSSLKREFGKIIKGQTQTIRTYEQRRGQAR